MTKNAAKSGVLKDILRGHVYSEVISTPHLSVNFSAASPSSAAGDVGMMRALPHPIILSPQL
ncbi:hypothetical protein IRJ41_021585 [Triplophysa rosa]|uniref:Uncharacterized protein n=1 Tax=Triplophysa rosa TaxID=992332 RepID=A0A9W7WWP1_TRIRA|nr:hypothetical protein IRJ41_021585 [Triplophysa rosa]